MCCQAYIRPFHITVLLSLFAVRGDVTTGAETLLAMQPFWRMSACPVVGVCACVCVCSPVRMQADGNPLACLPVCRHCGCHLFSSVSTNHPIVPWPAVLNRTGGVGQHRANVILEMDNLCCDTDSFAILWSDQWSNCDVAFVSCWAIWIWLILILSFPCVQCWLFY